MKYASLRQGLVGAWCPSLGPSGYTLLDRSGCGGNATLTNMDAGTAWQARQDGWWLGFDGVNDVATAGNYTKANVGTGPYTVSFFVLAAPMAASTALIAKDDWDISSTGFCFYTHSEHVNTIWHWASFSIGRSFGAIADNKVHHCAVSRSSTGTNDTRQYLDGRLINTYTDSSNYTNSRSLTFGNDDAGDKAFPGSLNDIRLYTRGLPEQEIKLLTSELGVGLKPERTSVFFGAQLFNAAWAKNSNQLISAGVI